MSKACRNSHQNLHELTDQQFSPKTQYNASFPLPFPSIAELNKVKLECVSTNSQLYLCCTADSSFVFHTQLNKTAVLKYVIGRCVKYSSFF